MKKGKNGAAAAAATDLSAWPKASLIPPPAAIVPAEPAPVLRRYHGATWDEPIVMELGAPGRRALRFAPVEREIHNAVGSGANLIPDGAQRRSPLALPELSEPEVLRHYLHLSQQTLGMMGISLFGTCTMKYNSRMCEAITARPQVADVHPAQAAETLQGTLEILHRFDLMLASSRAWINSCSRRRAERMRRGCSPASRAPSSPAVASLRNGTRSSRASRLIPAIRPLRRPPVST